MSSSDRALRLRDVAAEAVGALGLLVDDITVTPVGSRRVVRVVVDRDLGGLDPGDDTSPIPPISLDDVADASRLIDAALESPQPLDIDGGPAANGSPGASTADAVLGSGPYVLEVTSPGVDRPLREQRHFRRNVGRLVTIQTTDGERIRGRLTGVGADRLAVAPPEAGAGEPDQAQSLPLARVAHGRVEVEFARAFDEEPDELEQPEET